MQCILIAALETRRWSYQEDINIQDVSCKTGCFTTVYDILWHVMIPDISVTFGHWSWPYLSCTTSHLLHLVTDLMKTFLELVWSYVSTWWLMVDSQVLCPLHQKMQTLIQLAIVEDRLVEKPPGFTTFLIFTDIFVVMLHVKHLLTGRQVDSWPRYFHYFLQILPWLYHKSWDNTRTMIIICTNSLNLQLWLMEYILAPALSTGYKHTHRQWEMYKIYVSCFQIATLCDQWCGVRKIIGILTNDELLTIPLILTDSSDRVFND